MSRTPQKDAPVAKALTTDHAAVSKRGTVQQTHTHMHTPQQGSRETVSRKPVPMLGDKESEPNKNARKRRQRRQCRVQPPKEDIVT